MKQAADFYRSATHPTLHSDRKHAECCSDRNCVSSRVTRRQSCSFCILTLFHRLKKNSPTCSVLTNSICIIYRKKIENACSKADSTTPTRCFNGSSSAKIDFTLSWSNSQPSLARPPCFQQRISTRLRFFRSAPNSALAGMC